MNTVVKILLVIIVGVGLNITNPSKNDFVDFATEQIKKKNPELDLKKKSDEGTEIEKALVGFGNMLITGFLQNATTQKDYWIFSIYELDMKLARDFGVDAKNIKVLGFVGKFIPISGVE